MQQRREWALRLLRGGATLDHLIEFGRRHDPPLSEHQVRTAYHGVLDDQSEAFADQREKYRSLQIARLSNDLVNLRSLLAQYTPRPPSVQEPTGYPGQPRQLAWVYSAIARHEREWARVAGTHAPIRVELDANVGIRIRGAVMQVVGSLSDEQMDDLAAQQLEIERRAGVIDAHGDAVE